MLRVAVLGPVTAVLDDDGDEVDVTPTTGRERTALAALALAAPGILTVDALAGALYGDAEVRDQRNAVQAVVSRVRKALGSGSGHLETTPSGYRLVDTEIDVATMMRRRDDGDVAGALELWRGTTLGEVSGSGLIDNERTRLDELRSSLAEQLLGARLAADPAAAIGDLEAAVAEQPLREHRWELLMLALYRAGRQADALRAFRRARDLLAEELGLEPGRALTELEAQILSHDPALAVAPPSPDRGRRPLPTGTVTVLLCDVEGSVRRWESDPAATATLVEKMHLSWSDAIVAAGGVVVKSTGDGVLALFETASDAVRAAAAGQRGQVGTGLRVRVAVHTGEVVATSDDVRGSTVNRTARMLELAQGDQVIVSGTTAEVAGRTVADDAGDVSLRRLGDHWLRDVDEPVAIFQLVGDGLPSAFPPLRSHGPSDLPRPRHSLLGREADHERLVELLADHPLVTLLGTGGIGKTSLALSVGWSASSSRSVTFVDLASLQDPSQVAGRVAEVLVGVDPTGSRTPIERIVDRLRANDDLLIVDNAEHLLAAVASLADELLTAQLRGSLLVTSRQPLAVDGETALTLSPLPLPGLDDDLSATGSNPSVRLFLERMRTVSPAAELPDGMLPVVAHICRRLDGLPLAIELAAGRAALLTVQDIAARLDDQLRLLRQVPATREARHASLEAVVGWSLDQLDDTTRALFIRLAVMAGSFDVVGVERFAAHAGLDPDAALDAVSEMLATSLLTADPGGGRLRMLEPIRQYALAELRAVGHEASARDAHAAWITERAKEANGAHDARRSALFRSFDADADQLIEAIRWASGRIVDADATLDPDPDTSEQAHRAAELALASAFWFLEQDPGTGAKLFETLQHRLDRDRHPVAWARTTIARAIAAAVLPSTGASSDPVEAVAILDAADRDAGHLGDAGPLDAGDLDGAAADDRVVARIGAAIALLSSANPPADVHETVTDLLNGAQELIPEDQHWGRAMIDVVAMLAAAADPDGDIADAVSRGERAAALLRGLDDRWALGAALGELGRLHRARGDYDEAEACYLESIDLFGGLKYHGLHYIFSELGHLASLQGRHEAARRHHERGLQLALDDGNPGCHAIALTSAARSELLADEPGAAVEYLRRARSLRPELDLLVDGDELDDRLRDLLARHAD